MNADGDDIVHRHCQTTQHVQWGPLTCCIIDVGWPGGRLRGDVAAPHCSCLGGLWRKMWRVVRVMMRRWW
jgi:hypothetical protein